MRPLRIMLADPPGGARDYVYHHPTLGLLYLAGALRAAFVPKDVEVVYQAGFGSTREHLHAVQSYRPDLYAISFKTPMAPVACEALRAVHEAFPTLPIIAGGAHPTAMPEDVLRNSPASACFRGECEHAITRLVTDWGAAGPRFESIPGAVFRQGADIVRNDPAPFVHDLDQYPRPAWDLRRSKAVCGHGLREIAALARRGGKPRVPLELHILF
jgi:anaerobic magnesium-protoporphyrin IX monomethyl ester cyclase